MNGRTIAAILSLVILAPLAGDAQTGRKPVPGTRLDALCRIMNCEAPPRITNVRGNIMPGHLVLVEGSGFGSTPGWVVVQSPQLSPVQLTILEWHDHYIVSTVPVVTGVQDHNAIVKVGVGRVGAPPTESNHYPVSFKATVGVFRLPATAVRIQCAIADQAPKYHKCDYGVLYSAPTAWASHQSSTVGSLGASGTDKYSAKLSNGWVYHDSRVYRFSDCDPAKFVRVGFIHDSGALTLEVDWGWGVAINPCVWYGVVLFIRGPIGVPLQ